MNSAPTQTKTAAPVELDLDARLAEVGAIMTARLDQAAVAFEVNTAHIPAEPPAEITIPHLPQTAIPAPYSTPIAALLHRARARIEADGWTRGALREDGRRCLIGAIRIEAASRWDADDASALLLEVVQREFGGDTVPSWNDQQTSPRPVLLALGRAAELAHARGL
ncbi:DUF6197 family protein [Streptomyces sp. NPDC004059]